MKKRESKKGRSGQEKFREMILYLSHLSEEDAAYGMTKLNKLLFYADFTHFAHHGTSISGQEYQKLPHGPAPRKLLPKLNEMQRDGDLVVRERIHFNRSQRKPIALRAPKLNVFSPEEIDMINSVVDEFWGASAREMSDLSHEFAGWELAEEGDTVPYEVALVGTREPTSGELKWARSLRSTAQRALATAKN